MCRGGGGCGQCLHHMAGVRRAVLHGHRTDRSPALPVSPAGRNAGDGCYRSRLQPGVRLPISFLAVSVKIWHRISQQAVR